MKSNIGQRQRMRGMTTVGVLILVAFIGMFAFAAIQLTPVYLNYMKVAGVIEGVKEEFDSQSPSVIEIRRSIERRFGIESVAVIKARDIKVAPESGGFSVSANYDHTVPYLGNLSFSVHFEKSVLVRR